MPHVHAGSVRLYYEDTATPGPPLVLLPGLGMRVEQWGPHLPALAVAHRVIALDVRGGVLSDAPPPPYTTRQMADDTALALAQLGIEAAHFLGMSMGGFVVQELALAYPRLVRRAVLALTALRVDARGRARLAVEARLRSDPALLELHFRSLFLWLFDDATFERSGTIERYVAAAIAAVEDETAAGIEGRIAACLTHDATGRAGGVTAPTLVIGGEHDLLYPPRATRALAAAIPGSELVLLDAAHVPSGPAIRAFDDAVLAFLAREAG